MLELASLVASSLAVVWARKLDIQKALTHKTSREALAERITQPANRYSGRMRELGQILDTLMQRGLRTGFFCLMVSLAYSAAAYLFSLAVVSSSKRKRLPKTPVNTNQ